MSIYVSEAVKYDSVISDRFAYDTVSYYEPEFPEMNFCKDHQLTGRRRHFPHVVAAQLPNGTLLTNDSSFPCYMVCNLGGQWLQ